MLQRLYLIIVGAIYLGFSIPAILFPENLMNTMGLSLLDVKGFSEARGNYGGMLTGIGVLILVSVYRVRWRRAVFLMIAFLNGGYVAGRLVSLALDGNPGATMLAVLAVELLLCISAIRFYLIVNRETESAGADL